MKLSNGDKVPYSPREKQLFTAIAKRTRPASINDLTRFSDSFHARQSVRASLLTLAKKINLNSETFRLRNSKRRGPYPSEWWLEEK
jgi:hypothetical protein